MGSVKAIRQQLILRRNELIEKLHKEGASCETFHETSGRIAELNFIIPLLDDKGIPF